MRKPDAMRIDRIVCEITDVLKNARASRVEATLALAALLGAFCREGPVEIDAAVKLVRFAYGSGGRDGEGRS
jgi:hypothetical protein